MTIQIGMVGTDGILIAGDTKWTAEPRLIDRNWAAGRYGFNSNKIKISHERKLAVSCARNMETACHVANEIMSNLRDEEFQFPNTAIEKIGERALSMALERDNAQCLVAIMNPSPQLLLFQFGTINGEWGPICQRMETIAIAGDNLNAAIFWAERYYKKLPIEKLIPLAAHLISDAANLNSGTISGLEIVLCKPDMILRMSNESIQELQEKSKEWSNSIGDLFLSHRQQFTYAPNVIG